MNSIKQSSRLRELIKTEALKMFDKDYEVLIYSIIDTELENGITFKELINNNSKDDFQLSKLLEIEPTLTILVPELPLDSFSAKSWDISREIPALAIRTNTSNKAIMISPEGEMSVIPEDAIPGFPVLVIKNNERVICDLNNNNFSKYKTKVFLEKEGLKFKFWASSFDNTNEHKNLQNNRLTLSLDQKLIDAYSIYQTNYPNLNGWQRDYIYYGIQPSNPNGPFTNDFKEHIRSFKMLGTGMSAYNLISDQTGDPHYRNHHRIGTSHWTGGNYEFKVTTLINGTNGVGSEIINGFTVSPNDLFNLRYSIYTTGWWFWKRRWYRLESIRNKTVNVNVPIINWDLDVYSTSLKMFIEEVDLTTTTVITDTRTVKFATNFEFNSTLGEKVKLGLKFGASQEITETHTVQRTFTQGNDELQYVIANFGDKVIIQRTNLWLIGGVRSYYQTREYSTGLCQFSLEPKRVQ